MKTIELKKEISKQYFLTSLTEKEMHLIMSSKNDENKVDEVYSKIGIDYNTIELIGSTSEASPYVLNRYVSYLKGYEPSLKNKNRKVQFRDYTRKEEDQLKNAWLVSTCEDALSSSKTLLKIIKLPYICIWYKKTS